MKHIVRALCAVLLAAHLYAASAFVGLPATPFQTRTQAPVARSGRFHDRVPARKWVCEAATTPTTVKPGEGAKKSLDLDVVVLGGGPVGLATCAGLLGLDCTRRVTLIEKGPRDLAKDGPFSNVIGLGARAQKNLNEISADILENIRPDALSFGPGMLMADRTSIRSGLCAMLQDANSGSDRAELLFDTSAASINTEKKEVLTECGKTISYDLLVLADGVHSPNAEKLNLPALKATKYAHYDAFKVLNLPALPPPLNAAPRMHSFSTKHSPGAGWTDIFNRKIFFTLFPRQDGIHAAILRFPIHDGKNPRGISEISEMRDLILSMTPNNATLQDVYAPYLAEVLTDDVLQACVDQDPRAFWTTKRKAVVDSSKGIALIGDAALGFPSALGQGTARGFEDVTLLMESLREAAGSGKDKDTAGVLAAALARYEPEVKRERKAMYEVTILAMQANDTPWLKMPPQAASPVMEAASKYSGVKEDVRNRLWIWLARLTYATRRVSAPAATKLRASYKGGPDTSSTGS